MTELPPWVPSTFHDMPLWWIKTRARWCEQSPVPRHPYGAEEAAEWPIPDRLGVSYEVLERLGIGGQGVVYRVRRHGEERDLALKMLFGGAIGTSAEMRFVRERNVMADMDLEIVPSVVQVGEIGGKISIPYMTMELVDGVSLLEHVYGVDDERCLPVDVYRKGAPDLLHGRAPDRAYQVWWAKIVLEILAALVRLHRQGLVHRDIKPANILLTDEEDVRLIDFGLSVEIPDDPYSSERYTMRNKDERWRMVGTQLYSAPEASPYGIMANTRSDIYSLGMTVSTMMVGRAPESRDDIWRPEHLWPESEVDRRWYRWIEKATDDWYRRFGAIEAGAELAMLMDLEDRWWELTQDKDLNYSVPVPAIVGQADGLRQLSTVLATADRQHTGGLALLRGPADSGKTRVLRETRLAAEVGRQVLPSPGWSLRHRRLQTIYVRSRGDQEDTVLEDTLLELDSGPEWSMQGMVDILEHTRRVDGRPIVWLVDDVHLTSSEMREGLRLCATRLPEHWLMIWTLDPDHDPEWTAELETRARWTIDLTSLDAQETEQLIGYALEHSALTRRPQRLARILCDETEGVPGLILEYLEALIDDDTIRRDAYGRWSYGS